MSTAQSRVEEMKGGTAWIRGALGFQKAWYLKTSIFTKGVSMTVSILGHVEVLLFRVP